MPGAQAVVPRMGHRDEAIAAECYGAVGRLLAADAAGDGSPARDAVQLVADLVKLRRRVPSYISASYLLSDIPHMGL